MAATVLRVIANGIIAVGILFLGMFVGFLVATFVVRPWLHHFGTYREADFVPGSPRHIGQSALATVLGAVLGEVPVLFMHGLTYQKFVYPIGLVLGLSSIRILSARDAIFFGVSRASSKQKTEAFFAWIDLVAIGAIFLFALILTIVSGVIELK